MVWLGAFIVCTFQIAAYKTSERRMALFGGLFC